MAEIDDCTGKNSFFTESHCYVTDGVAEIWIRVILLQYLCNKSKIN